MSQETTMNIKHIASDLMEPYLPIISPPLTPTNADLRTEPKLTMELCPSIAPSVLKLSPSIALNENDNVSELKLIPSASSSNSYKMSQSTEQSNSAISAPKRPRGCRSGRKIQARRNAIAEADAAGMFLVKPVTTLDVVGPIKILSDKVQSPYIEPKEPSNPVIVLMTQEDYRRYCSNKPTRPNPQPKKTSQRRWHETRPVPDTSPVLESEPPATLGTVTMPLLEDLIKDMGLEVDREVLPIWDHHHDQTRLGEKAVPHQHYCDDCDELFTHTHSIKTYEESRRIQPIVLCDPCRLRHQFLKEPYVPTHETIDAKMFQTPAALGPDFADYDPAQPFSYNSDLITTLNEHAEALQAQDDTIATINLLPETILTDRPLMVAEISAVPLVPVPGVHLPGSCLNVSPT